jgi:hypothetical protein
VDSKAPNAGLVLPNEPTLGIFNEALQSVFRFFILDNWLYSVAIALFAIFSVLISKKCNLADSAIDKTTVGPLEKVLQRIVYEVKGSCSNTMWGLVFAVFMMLAPVLIRAGSDGKTQAMVNVLGFIPGVIIGAIQLFSASKIIVYVISKIPVNAPAQPSDTTKG